MVVIGLLGGTGNMGRSLLRKLLDRGHEVKAMARKPEKLDNFKHKNLTVIKGDVQNKEAVNEVCAGADIVISTLGNVGGHEIMEIAAKNILEAKPNRLIFISSLGVQDTSWCAWCLLRWCFAGKAFCDNEAADELLSNSTQNVTIVRPTGLESEDVLDAYNATTDKGFSTQFMSKADVAHFLADEVDKPQWEGKHPQLYKHGTTGGCCCGLCNCCCYC